MYSALTRRYAGERLRAWRARGVSVLVTPPVEEPVTVDTVKRNSRIDDSSIDYDLLPLRITAARQWVESFTGRALITQTWSYTLDELVDGTVPLFLPKVPLIDVTSVKTYSSEDVETTVPSTDYRVDAATEPGRILLDTAVGYWAADPRLYGGLTVTYRAGYGTTEESVPAVFRHAILLLVGELCERIEAASDLKLAEVPFGVRALLENYRVAV